jgi:preprotein translocase subunit Sec63
MGVTSASMGHMLTETQSATEKQIKSHYKRMSLKFHPDKIRPDPAKNETIETLNDHFVEITKVCVASCASSIGQ